MRGVPPSVNSVPQPAVPTIVLSTIRLKFNPIPRTANLVLFWSSITLAGFMRAELAKTFVEIILLKKICVCQLVTIFSRFGI